jgi:hypothetical protein
MKNSQKIIIPNGFIARLQKCHKALQKVESKTLEEMLNDYLLIPDFENELLVYEKIAKEYEGWLRDFPNMTPSQKKDLYLDLLWKSI